MQVRCKASAMVALAAAYAVVLQATLLAIGGPLFGSPAFASASLCAVAKGGSRHRIPVDRGDGCLAACLACCCSAVTPAIPEAKPDRSTPPRSIDAKTVAAAVDLPVSAPRAHRSRAPPLY